MGGVSRRLAGSGADWVQTGGYDAGPLATIPAATVAVHHASRERDAEPPAAMKSGRWPRRYRPGTLEGAVLNPLLGCPCASRVPEETAGQRSAHLQAAPMTAAARLRLNRSSTAPGKTQAAQIPAGSGRGALTWLDTASPELAIASVRSAHSPCSQRR